jgi:SAM-dependent methyltransferase
MTNLVLRVGALPEEFHNMPDVQGYLRRMAAPLQEKLKMAYYIPRNAKRVLDVGCADGTVTLALAEMFPHIHFHGIDLKKEFIELAKKRAEERGIKNVTFECVYLRELLARPEKYDVVLFLSVLHEFRSYGEGISSVTKAINDAHELLEVHGRLLIRDMILRRFAKKSRLFVDEMREKIVASPFCKPQILADFVGKWGELDTLARVNHFLLKYMYEDNWKDELKEDYIGTYLEQYEHMLDEDLEMRIEVEDSYTLPYLAEKWAKEFGLTPLEIAQLRSTTILVATKMPPE